MMVRSSHASIPPRLWEATEVIVSELASNAVRHAGTTFKVALTMGTEVRIEVADGSPSPPVLRHAGPADTGGRGLVLVDAYADRWGYDPVATGKVVWAELRAGA
jgi:anti-sigma regulatory factor (Ser/Thr protein kinase)